MPKKQPLRLAIRAFSTAMNLEEQNLAMYGVHQFVANAVIQNGSIEVTLEANGLKKDRLKRVADVYTKRMSY